MRNPIVRRIILALLRWFGCAVLPVIFLTIVWCATLGSFHYWSIVHAEATIFFSAMSTLAGIFIAIAFDANENDDNFIEY